MESPIPREEQTLASPRAGNDQLRSSFAEKDVEMLVDNKFNESQQGDFAGKTTNSSLGYINKNFASRLKEVIFLLYLAWMRPHLECSDPFWDPPQVQQRAAG